MRISSLGVSPQLPPSQPWIAERPTASRLMMHIDSHGIRLAEIHALRRDKRHSWITRYHARRRTTECHSTSHRLPPFYRINRLKALRAGKRPCEIADPMRHEVNKSCEQTRKWSVGDYCEKKKRYVSESAEWMNHGGGSVYAWSRSCPGDVMV